MSETLDQIEIKIAFLEKSNAELGDIVYRQGKEIEALHAKLAELTGRFDAAQDVSPGSSELADKPPHY